MNAPTVWEEGRWSADRVIVLAAAVCLVGVGLDVWVTGRVSVIFDLIYVLCCLGAALAVRPRDFFGIGVLPPLLILGCVALVSAYARTAVAHRDDGFVQGVVSGLAHHAGSLLIGYLGTLAILAIRHRFAARHRQANRDTSPAPTRVISG